jgi:hypothetical protein
MAALKQMFPTYAVTGEWRVWAKRVDKSYRIEYPHTLEQALAVAEEAIEKLMQYNFVMALYREGNFKEAAAKLMLLTETLPEKLFSNGYYNSSCGFHFSPYSNLIVDKYGMFRDDAEANIELMMQAAAKQDAKDLENLQLALDKATASKL